MIDPIMAARHSLCTCPDDGVLSALSRLRYWLGTGAIALISSLKRSALLRHFVLTISDFAHEPDNPAHWDSFVKLNAAQCCQCYRSDRDARRTTTPAIKSSSNQSRAAGWRLSTQRKSTLLFPQATSARNAPSPGSILVQSNPGRLIWWA